MAQKPQNMKLMAFKLMRQLGSESNAHGFARIFNSRNRKRKYVWLVLVCLGFLAATVQLTNLVMKYLDYQVVEISVIKESEPIMFPAITVCNIEPISSRKLGILLEKPDSHVLQWLKFLEHFEFANQTAHYSSIVAFYENVGDEALFVRHDVNDFIVHCHFNRMPCSSTNFSTTWDSNYYSCFTFNSGWNKTALLHSSGPQHGLSLVISLENKRPLLGLYGVYDINSNIRYSAGTRVVIHAPATMPSPVDQGFDVPPGFSSSVGLKIVHHTRLPQPYGNCSDGELIGTRRYRNSFFACLQICKQNEVMRKCRCKSASLPQVRYAQLSFCGTVPHWRKRLKYKEMYSRRIHNPALACEMRVRDRMAQDRSYEATCRCYQPCHETLYLRSISLSYWPLEFYQLDALKVMYGDRINYHFLNDTFQSLSDVMNKTNHTLTNKKPSIKQRIKVERASDLIRQNLLRLNVYLEDLSIVEFRQLPAYELMDLLAKIGGTLGLWMGVSILTIMEFIELVMCLVVMVFTSKWSARNADSNV
ncbi:FMRFamide-activated amiloride-sensitive sodium channel-like [Gigantopelta aegis]|uniref:FMRFamide-activated amiloride-sensitive sodium channel-like n=1 Tax=Gigantopelta aegis TaxID=1735272 RepID=UPI001B88948E|nr:FMRFamide-activated amiloride-sensitive sodium channel-like [Gigantopelta aegis]